MTASTTVPHLTVGELVTADGRITDAADDLFAHRLCWYLAWVLHQQTGWPLLAVTDTDPHPQTGSVGWVHVAVRTPTGRVLDVRGEHDPDQFLDDWVPWCDDDEAADLTPVAAERFTQVLSEDPSTMDGHGAAGTAAVARVLLAQLAS